MISVLVSSVVDDEFIGGETSMLTITSTDEPMIYHTRGKHANHYSTDEPTIYCFQDKNVSGRSWVHRWQVSVLFSKAVDHGFISGVMVSVSSTLTITPPMNPRSTAFETSTLTITPTMNPRSTYFETRTLTSS
jgi:hypothetical protein